MSLIGSHIARVCRLFGHLVGDGSRLAVRDRRPADDEKTADDQALRRELEGDLDHELLASGSKVDD